MMPHEPTRQGTSSSHGMAAAPARQHIWPCDLMHTVGETQRIAQQTQQSVGALLAAVLDLEAAHGLAGHAPHAPIPEEEAVVAAAAPVADDDRVVVERVAVAAHCFEQPRRILCPDSVQRVPQVEQA
ncbi:unnamed protein product [Prorocentrum cordatum]|uniref:Uncharacterized protein n=1 Tax=Prorocentrum cordatum TaxID=2364126 RepID=A0ABN9RCS7_9DINO|nr:unnamed protein product [Polarella glacialis]